MDYTLPDHRARISALTTHLETLQASAQTLLNDLEALFLRVQHHTNQTQTHQPQDSSFSISPFFYPTKPPHDLRTTTLSARITEVASEISELLSDTRFSLSDIDTTLRHDYTSLRSRCRVSDLEILWGVVGRPNGDGDVISGREDGGNSGEGRQRVVGFGRTDSGGGEIRARGMEGGYDSGCEGEWNAHVSRGGGERGDGNGWELDDEEQDREYEDEIAGYIAEVRMLEARVKGLERWSLCRL